MNEPDLSLIFKAIPVPGLILKPLDKDFIILAATHVYLAMVGMNEMDLLGKPFFTCSPYNLERAGKSSVSDVRDLLERAVLTRNILKLDVSDIYNSSGKTGSYTPKIEVTVSPVFNEQGCPDVLIYTLDRLDSNEDIALLIEHTDEGFLQVNEDLKIINYNNQFRVDYKKIFGKNIYKGDSILDYAVNGHERSLKNIYEKAFTGETIENEIDVPSENPEEVTCYRIRYKPVYDINQRVSSVFVTASNITEEKTYKAKLAANERLYKALVETASDVVLIIREDGLIKYGSPALTRLTGYTEEDVLNSDILTLIHEEDISKAANLFQESINNPHVALSTVNRLRHKDGSWHWYERTLTNLLNDPVIEGIVDNLHNITARFIAEKELLSSRDNFRSLVQSIDGIVWECDASTFVFNYVSPQSKEILGYAPGQWYQDSFWQNHIHPEDRERAINFCVREVKQNRNHDFEYRMIASDGRIVWLRDLVSLVEDPGKSKKLRGLMIDITKIKIAEKAKDFERREKEALINSTDDLIWSINKRLRLVASNRAFQKYTKDLTLGDEVLSRELYSEDYCNHWLNFYTRALNGESFIFETNTPEEDETDRTWFETSFNPIYKETNVIGVACFSRNITDKKRSELQLIQTNRKLKTAQKLAKLGYWESNLKTQKLFWSENVYHIFGLSSDSFDPTPESFLEIVHPEDRELFVTTREHAIKENIPFNLEHRLLLANGSVKWVRERAEIVKDNGTVTRIEGTVQDVTESKLTATALQESNERYAYVMRATFDAIWDWDLLTDNIYWGEGFETIFGHQLDLLKPDKSSWTDYIHPDDKERVLKGIFAVIDGNETNWTDEYRFMKEDATYAYVHDKGIVIRNKDHKSIRMIGAMHDITRQKIEEKLLKLQESVITHSVDSIMITETRPIDGEGPRIVFVNEAFTKMTGYSKEEVMGRSPRLLQGPETDRNELNRLRNCLENWKECQVEIVNYKKDGTEFWINIFVVPVADSSGWFTHWIAIERDVTERRNYVGTLEKQNETLRDIAWKQSHVVRAPLARIMGLVSILKADHDTDRDKNELIGYILRSAEELDEIITSIITAAGKLDS